MGKLLAYMIVSGIILLIMYLAYKLVMSRDNQHGFNRAVLLSIYAIAFTAFPIYKTIENFSLPSDNIIFHGYEIEIETPVATVISQPVWATVLIWIYIVGVLITALRTLKIWYKLAHIIGSNKKIRKDSYTLVITHNERLAPFSWIRYVVISHMDWQEDTSAIITHELKHIHSCHWIDLIIAQIACIINWFNPAAWLMRDELMLIHEYQADMAVINSGVNPQQYQILLIKKAVGSRFPSLANSINHSKLKKRITMMYKSKSGVRLRFKALTLVPMLVLALSLASVPAIKAAIYVISSSDVFLAKDSEFLRQSPQFKIISLNNSGIETTAIVKGLNAGNSISVTGATFTNKGNVYNSKSLNTNLENDDVIITAVFPFSENYENANITLNVNGTDIILYLVDFLNNSQSQSVSISPSNGIIMTEGNGVLSTSGMKIYFDGKNISETEMKKLSPEDIAKIIIDKKENRIVIESSQSEGYIKNGTKEEQSIIKDEQQPIYPGGESALYYALSRGIKFPKNLEKKSINAKVLINATINADGKFTEASLLKSSGYDELDA